MKAVIKSCSKFIESLSWLYRGYIVGISGKWLFKSYFNSLSRRASHFAAILTILFTIGVGSVWGEDVLVDIDFTSLTAQEVTQSGLYYDNRIYFDVKSGKKIIVSNSGINFDSQNGSAGTGGHKIGFLLEGVNKQFTVEITHDYSGKNFKFKAGYSKGAAYTNQSSPWSDYFSKVNTQTFSGLDGTDYVFWIGEASSSYKTIKSIRITTPTPCDGISPSLTYSKTTLQVGEQLDPTFNPDGSTGAVTYESNNTAAVTVDANGKITAVGAGMATIKASVAAANGKCAGEATVNILVLGTTGQHTLTWNLTVRESSSGESTLGTATTDIGTASTASTSTYLTSLTDLTGVGVKRTTDGKSNNTGKIETPSSYEADKYVTMTFAVASGYQFTPSSVSIKTVAVSTTKDLKFEFSDANGSYSVTKTGLSTSGTAATNTLDFSGCDKAFTGTVTVKIYVYGADNQYRLSTPLTIDGTVAAAATPPCTAPTSVTVSGAWDRFGGETISLTATPTGGSGTPSYQWQKKLGETWSDITDNATATTANLVYEYCNGGHSGSYRCVVSTGTDCSTISNDLQVKVYTLECYTNGTNIYHFTRNGNTQSGTLTLDLAANTAYQFKFKADNIYYGNSGTINKDETNWVCSTSQGNLTINSGLGGTFTITMDYSTGGNSNVLGEPEISVTYPRKTIYLVPNSDWLSNSAKFAFYYYGTSGTGWTDFLTSNDCGMSAEIPQWNGLNVIAVRFNSSKASTGNWDDKWNQTADIAATADKNCVTITDWNAGTYGTYSTPTYTISYNAGTGGSGSKSNETKTCGVDFTLPNSAVFTATGYTQTGWTTSDGGAQTHALGGSYTGNAAQTFYPVWTANKYQITYKESDRTTDISGLSPTDYTYGTGVETLPTPTKTGYTFDGWYLEYCVFEDEEGVNDPGHGWVDDCKRTSIAPTDYGNVTLLAQWTTGDDPEPGEGTCWNISDDAFKSLGNITENQTVNKLNIVATSDKNVEVEALKQQVLFDVYTFTRRLKLNGTGNGGYRHLKFAVTGDCTIDVYLISSGDEIRTLNVAIGSFGTNVTGLVAGTTIAKQTYEYTGGATDIYMYSANKGINIYQICVTYPATPDPEPGDCEDLVNTSAATATTLNTIVGSATLSSPSAQTQNSLAIKLNSSGYIELSPKADYSFEEGDKILVTIYNQASGEKTTGFNIGDQTFTASINGKSNYTFEETLTAANIVDGKVKIMRNSSDGWFVSIIIQRCAQLPPCTTPVLEDLSAQTKCPGEDVSWTASLTKSLATGESVSYKWTKKGSTTVLSSDATLTLTGITEATGGTYVVTATVSADGKASKTASKEVTLTVTPATATPTIEASATKVYAGNSVTLTATCASSGVGYQWYTCTDADGDEVAEIDGANAAAYTLNAGEAGTYYYKVIVTGDGSNSCDTAEKVYALVVSTSNSGETTCGEIKGQFTNGAYTFDTDFIIYGINSGGNHDKGASASSGNSRCGGNGWYLARQRFVVIFPVEVSSFSFIGYQSNQRTVKAVKTTTDLKTADTEYTTITHTAEVSQEGNCQTHIITPTTTIPANTFVWVELSNGLNLSEICYVPVSNVSCTDPEVIATIEGNATVCAGTENVTFTATNYADGASFQWQKKNGNTWENIDATSATYTISSVTTDHAGNYRVIATKGCNRISNELTLTVLTAPTFNTFATTASVMKGNALTINDVEATNATDYTWYKSADNSLDVTADTKVGTSKDLLLAAASITEEADQTFYLFCVASNSCGSVTSSAITVTVTEYVNEECATRGNEEEADGFSFENTEMSSGTYLNQKVWYKNKNSAYLTYKATEGKYFATVKVTIANSNGDYNAGYAYSTDGGASWIGVVIDNMTSDLTEKEFELPDKVNAFKIGRKVEDCGSGSGTFYLSEICFTYKNTCTATTTTPSATTATYDVSTGGEFTEPTFTVKQGESTINDAALTYTSSNTNIATVDEDGSVTFEGMTGTVTITAAYAGTTIGETEYCASEGSYTIIVSCDDQAPEIVAAAGTDLNGCNNSITLEAKMQGGTTSFTEGTYQWYRDGEAIEGATSASYEVVRAGTYTVSRTYTCTTMSSNSAVVKNENPEPKVERLTPFQYYHVNKTYSNQMKDRHLFAVTSYGTLDGKRYHLTATRNGDALDLSSSTAFFTISSSDNAVDTVMIDLNKLKNKYAENDKIVITCAPINNCNEVSAITSSITIYVIDQTPTLALICSGADGEGTRDTEKLVVGGDFLTGYNKADLCQQTGNKTFDPNTEWGFYTELEKEYIVTPVNGYAQFNKLNYEPFDILLLTDYPKSSKDEAAQKIIDDMAELCDYRPLLSFKTHFQSDKWKDDSGEYKYTKWVKKGFTTAPVVPKQTATYVNIVCYAHPMFEDIDDINDQYTFHDDDDPNQLVYEVLTGPGYEGSKGIQGFELADADNFVTIGLVHYNAIAEEVLHDGHTHISWNAEANDRLLVAMAERQTNIEARMMLFSLNCGAQSLQTPGGRNVILQCLKYLLETDPLKVADCRLTFDNGAGNTDFDPENYEGTGTKGDGLWSTAANWGPEYKVVPGRNNDVRIAAPCTVDANGVEVLSVHITEDGSLTIPADKSLTARSTILRADENGNVYPTNVEDISLGSNEGGNASLILNNERGDTKAGVAMYSTAKADTDTYSAANSTWQYIGTPHSDVANAIYNYYDSWLYQYDTGTQGWVVIPNGGPLVPFRGYCVTHPESPHTYWMEGTLAATTNQDISIPANRFVVVANSWTAPIQINELTDDDMEGLTDKSIYFFNTGSDPNQAGELNVANGRYAAGTYVSVPIHSAPYTGDSYIPSMQGFYVVGGSADGTLHLDYERHVRAKRENVPSGPMHAPARITDTDNEPQVAKFLFRGTRYDDRLIILERPDFTRGYDSGWDGEQWGGNAAAPMSYVVTETRWDAVSAIPEYEGTVIAFRAGEDSEYTIHFDYDGMEDALYLLDTDTQIYTRVLKGNSYTFTCADKAEHNRFILTRKAPQIATGTENINTGENAKAVKFIKDDKIFIFVNGILYDATGKMVIR